ncbi:MAG: MerR family transcriptional regulator [Candidatus Dojkabacteria bacterium]
MSHHLLTAGEFARLARTTKRTVLFYDKKGLLTPVQVNDSGYRLYAPEQIIDFQVILLLRKLSFSLEEIAVYLGDTHSLQDLFQLKKARVQEEIKRLQLMLENIEAYYANIEHTGSLLNPVIKKVQPMKIFFVQKVGHYADIKEYCLELQAFFRTIPENAIYFTVFEDETYTPKNAHMKVGVIHMEGMELLESAKKTLQTADIPGYTALAYVHRGSGTLLSLLWKELNTYREKHGLSRDPEHPCDRELYLKTSLNNFTNEDEYVFEMHIPIAKL